VPQSLSPTREATRANGQRLRTPAAIAGGWEKLESSAKRPLLKEALQWTIVTGPPSHLTTRQVRNCSKIKNAHSKMKNAEVKNSLQVKTHTEGCH